MTFAKRPVLVLDDLAADTVGEIVLSGMNYPVRQLDGYCYERMAKAEAGGADAAVELYAIVERVVPALDRPQLERLTLVQVQGIIELAARHIGPAEATLPNGERPARGKRKATSPA